MDFSKEIKSVMDPLARDISALCQINSVEAEPKQDRTILSGIHAYYEPEELVGKTLVAITNLPPRAMMGIDSCGMLLSAVHTEDGEEKLHLLMVDNHIPAGAKLY